MRCKDTSYIVASHVNMYEPTTTAQHQHICNFITFCYNLQINSVCQSRILEIARDNTQMPFYMDHNIFEEIHMCSVGCLVVVYSNKW